MYPDPATRNALEPGCARCPALVESRERIAWGNGSTDADVMVVGEAPGAGRPPDDSTGAGTAAGDEDGDEEDAAADRWRGGNYTGLAYTARHSGRIVREMFADLGYGPTALYVTNAVKCHPPENRDPTDEELDTCVAHLRAELRAVDPPVVATTGRHATAVLLDCEGVELDGFVERVLDPVDCPGLGTTVLPLLHPAYQHVWLARLGYDRESYVAAIGERLDALV
jgi:uracil-DNA glycosylase family 4